VKKGRRLRLVKFFCPCSSGLDKWTAHNWKQQYVCYVSVLSCLWVVLFIGGLVCGWSCSLVVLFIGGLVCGWSCSLMVLFVGGLVH